MAGFRVAKEPYKVSVCVSVCVSLHITGLHAVSLSLHVHSTGITGVFKTKVKIDSQVYAILIWTCAWDLLATNQEEHRSYLLYRENITHFDYWYSIMYNVTDEAIQLYWV